MTCGSACCSTGSAGITHDMPSSWRVPTVTSTAGGPNSPRAVLIARSARSVGRSGDLVGETEQDESTQTYQSQVSITISQTMVLKARAFSNDPALGWVRADQENTTELSQKHLKLQERLGELRAENDRLSKQIAESKANPLTKYAFGDDLVQITVTVDYQETLIEAKWESVFLAVASLILPREEQSTVQLLLIRTLGKTTPDVNEFLTNASLIKIRDQFLACELIEVYVEDIEPRNSDNSKFGQLARQWASGRRTKTYWKLTALGTKTYAQSVAILRKPDPSDVENQDSSQLLG